MKALPWRERRRAYLAAKRALKRTKPVIEGQPELPHSRANLVEMPKRSERLVTVPDAPVSLGSRARVLEFSTGLSTS